MTLKGICTSGHFNGEEWRCPHQEHDHDSIDPLTCDTLFHQKDWSFFSVWGCKLSRSWCVWLGWLLQIHNVWHNRRMIFGSCWSGQVHPLIRPESCCPETCASQCWSLDKQSQLLKVSGRVHLLESRHRLENSIVRSHVAQKWRTRRRLSCSLSTCWWSSSGMVSNPDMSRDPLLTLVQTTRKYSTNSWKSTGGCGCGVFHTEYTVSFGNCSEETKNRKVRKSIYPTKSISG
jgi:hypothetical protein